MHVAAREAGNVMTGVAEHHPAGAGAVQQLGQDRLTLVFTDGHVRQQAGRLGFQVRRPAVLVMELAGQAGDFLVVGLFFAEGIQARVAIRVQQAQARVVAFQAKLFRGGGEQQQATGLACNGLYSLVIVAGGVWRPFQMVGFVHHQQIPVRCRQLINIALGKKIGAAQDQLFTEEGVVPGFLRILCVILVLAFRCRFFLFDNLRQHILDTGLRLQSIEPFCIENGKVQIETTHHFHKPLVHER